MTDDTSVQQSTTTQSPGEPVGIGTFADTSEPPTITSLASFPTSAAELRRSDIQLVEQAIKRGWTLSDKTKAETVKAAEWIRDHSKDARARLRAAEFLLQVDKHNLEVVKAFQPKDSPTTAVQVNVTGGSVDLSRLTDAELEARRAELVARTTKPPALPGE